MEEKKPKKKLTLSIGSKKPYNFSNYHQSGGKKSVIIEKKNTRRSKEGKYYNRDNNKSSSGFINKRRTDNDNVSKNISLKKNFEIRKLAEQRATKRFKNFREEDSQPKKGGLGKSKSSTTKREYKLTLSKALDE